MIERYSRPEMGNIWTLENRYQAWLDVEVAVCRAWSEMGRIPAEAVKTISDKAAIVAQLETVLARLKAGDTSGQDHDDDFGYAFEYLQAVPGPSFFDEPAGSA